LPQELIDRFGYRQLTPQIKSKILGLNATKVYGIDVAARRRAISRDYVSKLKTEYRAAGAMPSNTQYGWIRV
jgi:hypothetical protein